ncbi:MAG: hypothetical protein LBQ73_07235 [Tannerellaceae bacterium]|jgi:hypothetical protein|nr:hypothetical protein [Tannerellaceae bacterium]
MKAMIILLTAPMMLFFTIAAASTVEWCLDYGYPIPWWHIAGIVVMDIVWGVCSSKCSKESMDKALREYKKFTKKLIKTS